MTWRPDIPNNVVVGAMLFNNLLCLQMAKVQFPDVSAHEEMLARRNELITAIREVSMNYSNNTP